MSTIEIVSKIEALKEWEALAEEAAAEIESDVYKRQDYMSGRKRYPIKCGPRRSKLIIGGLSPMITVLFAH